MKRTKYLPKKHNKPGPKGYFEESMIEEVFKLARFGMTNKEIAEFYNISVSTFEGYQRKYPEFNGSLQKGRLLDSLKVVASLHKQALGYDVEEEQSNYKIDKQGNKTLTFQKTTTKHIQPNTTACIYILKTRHGDKWMDLYKAEFNSTNNVNVNIDFTGFTDDELRILENIGMKQLALKSTNAASRN